jgi:hypothetical protein
MKIKDKQELLRLYLLGQLPEDLQQEMEERYFVDDYVFQELQQAEEALIEDYARAKLNQKERYEFAKRYLRNPEKRRKVELTAELIRRSSALQIS